MFTSDERRDFERTVNAIYAGSVFKGEMSLAKWCDRTRTTVNAVRVLFDELDNNYNRDKDKYSTPENNKRYEKMKAEKREFENIARSRIKKDLDSVLTAKREAFSKAMAAPDEKALRLLQTLQMRQNISASEIAATVEHLSGNLQALSVLSEIAKKNGVSFPKLNTDYFSEEQRVKELAEQLLNDIFTDDPRYLIRLFLSENGNNGQLMPFVDALDSPSYLDCDVSQIVEMPEVLKNAVRDGIKEAIADGGMTNGE